MQEEPKRIKAKLPDYGFKNWSIATIASSVEPTKAIQIQKRCVK